METRCTCDKACYLTDYGRHSWSQTNTRFHLRHGMVTMETAVSRMSGSPLYTWRHWSLWIQTNMMVLVIVVMLLLTTTMPLLWHWRILQNTDGDLSTQIEDEIPDAKLTRILRSLNSIRSNQHDSHLVTRNNITHQFPWLQQNNSQMNYFLSVPESSHKSSHVVFLHQFRSGGEAIVQCLQNISLHDKHGAVPIWDSDRRELWDGKLHSKSPEAQVHAGSFTMGLCDIYHTSQCSYFTVFREPMERAVSIYHYCKGDAGRHHEMCRIVDANDVTLRDWILLQGSTTFQQLVFHPTWCTQHKQITFSLKGSAIKVTPANDWPCWFKHRIELERLPTQTQSQMLDYIVENLEHWFGVIGLVEDWQGSIDILRHVYHLPVEQCPSLHHSNHPDISLLSNKANNKLHRDGYYDDNDPNYLRYDYFIRKALEADFRIYNKAKEIFNLQRQMVYNKISR